MNISLWDEKLFKKIILNVFDDQRKSLFSASLYSNLFLSPEIFFMQYILSSCAIKIKQRYSLVVTCDNISWYLSNGTKFFPLYILSRDDTCHELCYFEQRYLYIIVMRSLCANSVLNLFFDYRLLPLLGHSQMESCWGKKSRNYCISPM